MFTKQFARQLTETLPGLVLVKFPRAYKGDRRTWGAWQAAEIDKLAAAGGKEVK